MKQIFLWISIAFLFSTCQFDAPLPIIYKWDTFTLDVLGPEVDEMDEENPFLNYRLMIEFKHDSTSMLIPGYFAADGNAAETSATKGNVWRVKFTPNFEGVWTYTISFKKGKDIIYSSDLQESKSIGEDGKTGQFKVVKGTFSQRDFRSQGRLLKPNGKFYQQFAESKKYYLKGGADSPENLLAYQDFDGTYAYDSTRQFIKSYSAHIQDYQTGDPTWQNGKGKGLIGALNYLSSKGMNAIYFLTMNIEGDGKDVWMYTSHEEHTRFDCSKLDQWEIVFQHAQKKGILLHFVTQETENELLLDNGDTEKKRQLYYRELIARFGHHLALTWNMGEENGPADFTPNGQTDTQRKAMFAYFKTNDPYQNMVALHTHSNPVYKDSILLPILGDTNLDALSMQIHHPDDVAKEMLQWRKLSIQSGHSLLMNMDEIGPYWQGVLPDENDIQHDTVRQGALWGALMSGAAGMEWYFGYKYPHADLTCEDWRSRDQMWTQTKYALDFFQKNLPFWEMEPTPHLLKNGEGYCFSKQGELYVVYLKDGNPNAVLETTNFKGHRCSTMWYDPQKGGNFQNISSSLKSENTISLGEPPVNNGKDWIVLVKRD